MKAMTVQGLIRRLEELGEPNAEVHLVVDGIEEMEYRPLERLVFGTYSDQLFGTYSDQPIAWLLGEDIPDSLADQLAEPGR